MADISASAEKRADILLKNAELDAQLMQKEAKAYGRSAYLKRVEAMKVKIHQASEQGTNSFSSLSSSDSNPSAARCSRNSE